MSHIVIRGSAFSNISYDLEYETEITPEEWAELSYEEKNLIYDEAVYSDIEVWEEVVDE